MSNTLSLMYIHDILVSYKIEPPMSYIDLWCKIENDVEYRERLMLYYNLMSKKA